VHQGVFEPFERRRRVFAPSNAAFAESGRVLAALAAREGWHRFQAPVAICERFSSRGTLALASPLWLEITNRLPSWQGDWYPASSQATNSDQLKRLLDFSQAFRLARREARHALRLFRGERVRTPREGVSIRR
jgi:hypothetical protein